MIRIRTKADLDSLVVPLSRDDVDVCPAILLVMEGLLRVLLVTVVIDRELLVERGGTGDAMAGEGRGTNLSGGGGRYVCPSPCR